MFILVSFKIDMSIKNGDNKNVGQISFEDKIDRRNNASFWSVIEAR